MLARSMNVRHITSARSTLPSLFCPAVLRKKEITFTDLTEGERINSKRNCTREQYGTYPTFPPQSCIFQESYRNSALINSINHDKGLLSGTNAMVPQSAATCMQCNTAI